MSALFPATDAPTETTLAEGLAELILLSRHALSNMPDRNALGQARVSIDAGTLPVVTTVSSVTGVTTLSNITSIGGYQAAMDQFAASNMLANALRDRVTVS